MGKFKIGDNVRLKTDRTETMVVIGYEEHETPPTIRDNQVVGKPHYYFDETNLICSWHDKKGMPQGRIYPEDALELVHTGNPNPIIIR